MAPTFSAWVEQIVGMVRARAAALGRSSYARAFASSASSFCEVRVRLRSEGISKQPVDLVLERLLGDHDVELPKKKLCRTLSVTSYQC